MPVCRRDNRDYLTYLNGVLKQEPDNPEVVRELAGIVLRAASLESVLDAVDEGAYCVGHDRRILHWNRAAHHITGFLAPEVVGHYCYHDLLQHTDARGNPLCSEDTCPLHKSLQDGLHRQTCVFMRCKEGNRLPVKVDIIPIFDGINEIIGALEIFRSCEEEAVLAIGEETLPDGEPVNSAEPLASGGMAPDPAADDPEPWDRSAVHPDAVEGLAERRFVEHCLEHHLAFSGQSGHLFGGFMVTVDGFPELCARHGSTLGRLILREIGQTISAACRSADLVGYWDDHRLVGIIGDMRGPNMLRMLLDEFRQLAVQAIRKSSGGELDSTISIGATLPRADDTMDSLVRRMEQALDMDRARAENTVRVL